MAVEWGLGQPQGGPYDYLQSLQQMGQIAAQKQGLAQNQYNFNRQRTADQQRPQILTQARAGDFSGAQDTAFANGDMDALKFVSGLQENQRKIVADHADTIASVAANLSALPEGPDRLAAFDAALPSLAAKGFTPDELAQARSNLSNNGLKGYIAAASTTKDALETYYKSQQALTVADGAQVFGATPMGGGPRPLIAENTKDITPQKPVWDSARGGWVYPPSASAPTGSMTPLGGGTPGTSSGPGGNPYDVVLGNGAYGKPPAPLTSMTLGDVYDFGRNVLIPNSKKAGVGRDNRGLIGSSAAGAYQITGETLRRIAPQVLGADWEQQTFTPEVQDRLGEAIYNDAQRSGTPLNKVWASLSPQEAASLQGKPWSQVRDTIVHGETGIGGAPQTPQSTATNGSFVPIAGPRPQNAPAGYQYTADGHTLEPIKGGPADPSTPTSRNVQSNRKAETDYRKEFEQRQDVKSFVTARNQYYALRKTALNPNATASDDISSVYSFMKALDPQSVVREGEFATVQNATGVPDRMKNYYNQMLKGTRLNANQRQDMVNTAYRNYSVMRDNYNNVATQYRGYAQSAGVNPDNVARTYTVDEKKSNAPRPQPKAGWKITERK